MSVLNKQASARAHLLGLATTQLLCCRTKEALDHLRDFVEEYKDARDEIPEALLEDIQEGNIRMDTYWSQGLDTELANIASATLNP
jgi:hypothetical protein